VVVWRAVLKGMDRVYAVRHEGGEELKCGGCNWRVSNLYVLARDVEEARQLLKRGEAGLCGDCFSEMLSELTNGGEVKVIYVGAANT